MRIGKRIVACGMCLSMALGMVACGGEEGNKETSGSSNATVNETVANKPTESTTKAELYSPTEEIMSAKMGEGKVQLGNQVITLGETKVRELKAKKIMLMWSGALGSLYFDKELNNVTMDDYLGKSPSLTHYSPYLLVALDGMPENSYLKLYVGSDSKMIIGYSAIEQVDVPCTISKGIMENSWDSTKKLELGKYIWYAGGLRGDFDELSKRGESTWEAYLKEKFPDATYVSKTAGWYWVSYEKIHYEFSRDGIIAVY